MINPRDFKTIRPDIRNIVEGTKKLNQTLENKMVSAINNPKKAIKESITDIVTINSTDVTNKAKEVMTPLSSIAQKTLDNMEKSEIPILKKGAEFINNNPHLNPTNVMKKTIEIIDKNSQKIETNVEEMNVDIAKSVIKKKSKNLISKNKFINFFKNIFAKIKNLFNINS